MLGSSVFLGGEFAYHARSDFPDSLGRVNLRFRVPLGTGAKAFATVGRVWQSYSATNVAVFPFGEVSTTSYGTFHDTVAGVGYAADLSENGYVSVQYQHAFDLEGDRAMVGIGVTFQRCLTLTEMSHGTRDRALRHQEL